MGLIQKALKRPWLILPYFLMHYGGVIADEPYIKIVYFLRNGKRLNLKNPVTYFDKINWMKLHDRRAVYTTMVDKYEVKKYAAEKIGEEYIIPVIGVWDSPDEINLEALPDQFVLKTTHDGGATFICADKKKFDFSKTKTELKRHLRKNYYKLSREWPYKNVKPRVICEKYIPGIVDSNYKFFCFDGKVKFLYVAPYREAAADYFDRNFKHLRGIHNAFHSEASVTPVKPDSFEEMRQLAETMSQGYPQMRVDFYDDHGKIYFGEITFFQEGGFAPWKPDKWNYIFGKYIDIPADSKAIRE